MEAIIAVITIGGGLLSSLGSVYIDRKFRDGDDEEKINSNSSSNINLSYHEIFNYLNTSIKNNIPYMYFGNELTNDMVRSYLIQRLNYVKINIKKLLEIESELDKISNDIVVRKISDMLNGLNEYKDVQNSNLYEDIPIKFIKNFNNWNNRCYSILLKYLQQNIFIENKFILNNFFNVYLLVIESMINNIISNLYLIIEKDCKYKGYDLNYNVKNVPNILLKRTMTKIRKETNIEEYINNILISEKNKLFKKKNLLFCINNDFEIIYCSILCIDRLNYKIDKLIGSHIITLCASNEDLEEIDDFLNNDKKVMLIMNILSKDNEKTKVVIKKLEEVILCFLIN
jgi:hypothetical protein